MRFQVALRHRMERRVSPLFFKGVLWLWWSQPEWVFGRGSWVERGVRWGGELGGEGELLDAIKGDVVFLEVGLDDACDDGEAFGVALVEQAIDHGSAAWFAGFSEAACAFE